MAGKGDMYRRVDRKKWDACPLWDNIGKHKKQLPIQYYQTPAGTWAFEGPTFYTAGFNSAEDARDGALSFCLENHMKHFRIERRK